MKPHKWGPCDRIASRYEATALRTVHPAAIYVVATGRCRRCLAVRVSGAVPVAPGYARTVRAVVDGGAVVTECLP